MAPEREWAPLLFRDEKPPLAVDPVAPATRSQTAIRKVRTQRLEDGAASHNLRTALSALKSLTLNRVRPIGAPASAEFDILSTATPLQLRALSLLGLKPSLRP